jgi:hypothetical protein
LFSRTYKADNYFYINGKKDNFMESHALVKEIRKQIPEDVNHITFSKKKKYIKREYNYPKFFDRQT